MILQIITITLNIEYQLFFVVIFYFLVDETDFRFYVAETRTRTRDLETERVVKERERERREIVSVCV